MNGQLPRIAVLGANGQVGTELCLFLKVMGFCEPIAITRSPTSTGLLTKAGIECRPGDVSQHAVAAKLLGDCVLVFDLSLPLGKNLHHTKRLIRARFSAILSAITPSAGFVLASTTAVQRSSPSLPFFRAYRSAKLFAERQAIRIGRVRGVRVHVLRLGQVHGELQACSVGIRERLSLHRGPVCVPDQTSNAVFVVTIAEALRAILQGTIRPAVYTMMQDPAWTFAQVVEWYADRLGVERPTIVREAVTFRSPLVEGAASVRRWLAGGVAGLVEHYRELMSAAVSAVSEDLEQRLRFRRIRQKAGASIAAYRDSLVYRPFQPLMRISGLPFRSSAVQRDPVHEQAVRDLLRKLT